VLAVALLVLGVGLFIRARGFSAFAFARTAGGVALLVLFLLGTLFFRKSAPTDEFKMAMQYAESGEVTKLRQAMVSFEKFPEHKKRWVPLVTSMLEHPDHVAREDAATLLGKSGDLAAVPSLLARLSYEKERDDAVREKVVKALRALDDASAAAPLVSAASQELEADIAVVVSVSTLRTTAAAGLDTARRPYAKPRCSWESSTTRKGASSTASWVDTCCRESA